MNLTGTALKFPFSADERGALTTATGEQLIAQEILMLVLTRQGERVCLPDFGLPDFIFSVMDAGFAARLSFYLEEQILKYVPLVESVVIKNGIDDAGRATIVISYKITGQVTAPDNLVFPVWQLRGDAAE